MPDPATLATLAIAAGAFLVAGLVKGVVGFGFPVIALAIMTIAIGLLDALAIVILPAFLTNLWQATSGGHLRDIVGRLWSYMLMAVIFIVVGSRYLNVGNAAQLTATLGGLLCLYAVFSLARVSFVVPRKAEPVLAPLLGIINGTLTGLTGSFMVPSVFYLHATGFRGEYLVQALGIYFCLSSFTLAASMAGRDLISIDHALLSALALVPSFVGMSAGRRLRRRIDPAGFERAFFTAVLLLGASLLWRAARGSVA
ncbi:MAG: sulfite exporter TauE/SafE family protein [Gammaproteobacteria bacterium]|nr:sulfite exporter TauE/SafE family protein [Gammaproteobacteria bacterium]MDH4255142.1 sulfite exporter TauE/SafE family protein [Gammaproteobacteria bacterium]MDH5311635.1 sulfite exporter TauE/SafE family protein [Gammaproteobacteria bacterium]